MLCVVCVEWANFAGVGAFRPPARVGVARRGRVKRADKMLAARTHSARGGALRARVMLLRGRARLSFRGRELKKRAFCRKKIQKTPPEYLRRAGARLYTDGRAFFACLSPAWARTLRVYGNPRPKIRPEIRRKERDGRGACAEIAQMRRSYGAVWQPQRGRQPRQYPRARTPARTVGGCVHGQT